MQWYTCICIKILVNVIHVTLYSRWYGDYYKGMKLLPLEPPWREEEKVSMQYRTYRSFAYVSSKFNWGMLRKSAHDQLWMIIRTHFTCMWKIYYNDILKWKSFPYNWPFASLIFLTQRSLMWIFYVSLIMTQTNCWISTRVADGFRHGAHVASLYYAATTT